MKQAVIIALPGLILGGCAAPFSDFQSARMAGKGKVEATAQYSAVSLKDTKVQDQFGLQAGVGISDEADIRFRYERLYFEDSDDEALQVFGMGPKLAMNRDHTAFYFPVGFAFGEDVESSKTWEFHPTILTTYSIGRFIEINISFKVMLSLVSEGPEPRVALNLGLGIGPDATRYMLRPEAGIMIFPSSPSDPYFHFGVGVSIADSDKRRDLKRPTNE